MLLQHVLPEADENVRLGRLREHQVVRLHLYLRIHVWLVELVILLEPNIALKAGLFAGASQLDWLTNRDALFPCCLAGLGHAFGHVDVGRWVA